MGDILLDGGRLGVTGLDVKRFKAKALGDEILLNKEAGIYYYKTKEDNIISIDYIERVGQIKDMIVNEMSKNLLFNFDIYHLSIAPILITGAVQELLNPTLAEDKYEVLSIDSSKSDKFALSLFLDIIELSNEDDEFTKFLVNNIYDKDYTASVTLSDSNSLANSTNIDLSAVFSKLNNSLGADLSTLTGKVTIKNVLLQNSTIDTNKSRHLLGAYVIAVPINDVAGGN